MKVSNLKQTVLPMPKEYIKSNMQPLLKWPGGKSKEFEFIKDIIPAYSRYVEPFFGGGAVYFKLQPQKAVINDIADELVDLYRFAKGELKTLELKIELEAYCDNWDKISEYILPLEEAIASNYRIFSKGDMELSEFKTSISKIVDKETVRFNGLFSEEFCVDRSNLVAQIKKNLTQKLVRTVKIEATVEGGFDRHELFKNIETGFKSGFYMHFRDLLNYSNDKYKMSRAKHIANWFYVREYCYGSMFRFNADGKFNIPYGGIGYNPKSLKRKIDYIFSDELKQLLSGAEIYKLDFSKLMETIKLTKDDFIFLDPPYDTEFSSYEGNTFDKSDQKRLADILKKTPAKWIMIIKNTDYISSLYKNSPGILVEGFEKNYLYNVKGRNDRAVEHLIIKNY